MPEVSRFFGIVITMYHNDHGPPHFHVRYGEQKALVELASLGLLAGAPEWAAQHRGELEENWYLAQRHQPLKKIQPLE